MNRDELCRHVNRSIIQSFLGVSNLNKDIFYLDGMSSPKVRMLLNNLCEMDNTNYLEVGSWKGSTLVSALYNNINYINKAIAIDNFAGFNDSEILTNAIAFDLKTFDEKRPPQQGFSKEILFSNINKFISNYGNKFSFYEGNCFNDDLINKIIFENPNFKANIYFYDGGHDEEEQVKAFTKLDCLLDDVFVCIIDDWNDKSAELGTRKAISIMKYNILNENILPSNYNGDIFNWWQGLYVAVLVKENN